MEACKYFCWYGGFNHLLNNCVSFNNFFGALAIFVVGRLVGMAVPLLL